MPLVLTSTSPQSCTACGALPFESCVNADGAPLSHIHVARTKAENDDWKVKYDELYRDNTIKRFDVRPYGRKKAA
jgi:hypothetical protein